MRAWITRYTDKIDALSTEKELMALFDASRNAVNALPKPFDEAIKNYELKALNRVYGDESWSPFSNEQLAGLARLEQLRGKKSAPPATTSATA